MLRSAKDKLIRRLYTVAFLNFIFILVVQYQHTEVFGALHNDTQLNIALTVLLGLLTIPNLLHVVCQLLTKAVLWPIDLHFYGGKCSFNSREANTILGLHNEVEQANSGAVVGSS